MDNKQQSNINYNNNNTTTSEHYTNISNRPEFLSAAFTSTENLQPTSLQAQRYINHNYNNNHESGIDASSLAQTELLRGIRSEHSYGPSSALGGFDYSSLQPASLAQYSTYSKQNDMSLNPKQAYNNYSRSDKLELQATVLPELSKNESIENNIPPCAPGGFIDPNCHFYVSEDPLSTLQSLVSLLRDSNVDCQLSSEEYKIRCQAYKDHSRVEFVVRIFSSSTPNNNINRSYAIEFQRRFGDGVFFHRIFRDAKATLLGLKHESRSNTPELQNHSITQTTTETTNTETSNNEPMECLPCPSLCKIMLANLDKPCIIECVSKSIRCLVSMCETECVDIKSQGLIALAAMSDRVDFHNYLHKYGALELFLESIYCNYEDIHRCCCTGLANLTENNRDLCQQIMENTKLKERLCNLSHSTCPEVVRQVAKIVKNLSTLEPILLAKDKDLREVVEYLAVSSDEQARAAAVAVLDTIPV